MESWNMLVPEHVWTAGGEECRQSSLLVMLPLAGKGSSWVQDCSGRGVHTQSK